MSEDPRTPVDDARVMARADVLAAIVLLALGIATLWGGYTMDRLEVRQIHPASIPGLVPMALGAALSVLSLVLLASAVKAGGHHLGRGGPLEGAPRDGLLRLLGSLAWSLAYPILLIGNMPFWLATAIYVSVFIAGFEWRSRRPAGHALALGTAVLQGVVVGVVIAFAFEDLFLVRLP